MYMQNDSYYNMINSCKKNATYKKYIYIVGIQKSFIKINEILFLKFSIYQYILY